MRQAVSNKSVTAIPQFYLLLVVDDFVICLGHIFDLGFAGVGIYPVSGFVHVDVRERSYFWVDTSGPGKRSRVRGILADLAAKSDSQAIARGEHSVGPFLVGTDVNAVVGAVPAPAPAAPVEEDEGDVATP